MNAAAAETLSCLPADPCGPQFAAAIQQELERINAFYSDQEQQLEVVTMLSSSDEVGVCYRLQLTDKAFDSPVGCRLH